MNYENKGRSESQKRADAKYHDDAWMKFLASGESSVRCNECGEIIHFEKISEFAYKSTCKCGRYNCTVRA